MLVIRNCQSVLFCLWRIINQTFWICHRHLLNFWSFWFVVGISWNCLSLKLFTYKVRSSCWVWRTRLQVTWNLITVLYSKYEFLIVVSPLFWSLQMDSDSAVDLLKKLKDLPITLEVLQKTRIGMSVNTLRKKSENSDLQTQAKSLIKSWKKLLPGKMSLSVKLFYWKWRMISTVYFQFKQLERRSLKKSVLQRDSNPWPPRYRCDALPTELWSHTLGARSIYWVHINKLTSLVSLQPFHFKTLPVKMQVKMGKSFNIDRFQYWLQPIKFVNLVFPSPCETEPYNNLQ